MIIKKNIETGIDIHNPINVATDPENIRHILVDRFEGKCYRGCWIKSVNKILRVGECVINQDGDPNWGTIPVIMEVTAVVFAIGEIINGCVVQNKEKNGAILLTTDIASIMLMSTKILDSITVGKTISIRVAGVRYNQGSVKISINAIPYLFTNKPVIYKIDEIAEKEKILFENILERISFEESEMNKLKKENPKAWETFDQLLYAYKEPQNSPAGAKIFNILNIAESGIPKEIKYLSRDPRINLSLPNVYGYSIEKFPPDSIQRFEVPSSNVICVLLEDYCAHLRTIREMISIYSTPEIIESHRALWQIFKKNKY